jgi:hypothetical protein
MRISTASFHCLQHHSLLWLRLHAMPHAACMTQQRANSSMCSAGDHWQAHCSSHGPSQTTARCAGPNPSKCCPMCLTCRCGSAAAKTWPASASSDACMLTDSAPNDLQPDRLPVALQVLLLQAVPVCDVVVLDMPWACNTSVLQCRASSAGASSESSSSDVRKPSKLTARNCGCGDVRCLLPLLLLFPSGVEWGGQVRLPQQRRVCSCGSFCRKSNIWDQSRALLMLASRCWILCCREEGVWRVLGCQLVILMLQIAVLLWASTAAARSLQVSLVAGTSKTSRCGITRSQTTGGSVNGCITTYSCSCGRIFLACCPQVLVVWLVLTPG